MLVSKPLSNRQRRHLARAAEERREVCRLWLKIARIVRRHTGLQLTLPLWVNEEIATW